MDNIASFLSLSQLFVFMLCHFLDARCPTHGKLWWGILLWFWN